MQRDVAIVGAGFAGIAMAIALREAGHEDFVVLERAGGVGGTWRQNRYPGCACDVPAPLYALARAPSTAWSRTYGTREELHAYLEACAARHGVLAHLRCGAEVVRARWDEERLRWRLRLASGEQLTARVLIAAPGALSEPALPAIEGLERFAGPLVHTAAWPDGLDLRGRRVAVIGTGASAVQLVPRLAREAAQLVVFQRTPPWVLPKRDRAIGPRERALLRRLPMLQRARRTLARAVGEGVGYALASRPALLAPLERRARAHLARQVPDPALRARLTPGYRIGCKRILLSSDWYPALAREHVTLATEPIARVEEGAIVTADGTAHAVDAIVCATGFAVAHAFLRLGIRGRDGRSLARAWAGGAVAHRGTTVAGFPNLMLLSGPNSGTGSTSQLLMIEAQARYVVRALAAMRAAGAASVEVRQEAQEAWSAALAARAGRSVWVRGGCDSWYLDGRGRNGALHPGAPAGFVRALRRFRPEEHRFAPPPPAHRPPPACEGPAPHEASQERNVRWQEERSSPAARPSSPAQAPA